MAVKAAGAQVIEQRIRFECLTSSIYASHSSGEVTTNPELNPALFIVLLCPHCPSRLTAIGPLNETLCCVVREYGSLVFSTSIVATISSWPSYPIFNRRPWTDLSIAYGTIEPKLVARGWREIES